MRLPLRIDNSGWRLSKPCTYLPLPRAFFGFPRSDTSIQDRSCALCLQARILPKLDDGDVQPKDAINTRPCGEANVVWGLISPTAASGPRPLFRDDRETSRHQREPSFCLVIQELRSHLFSTQPLLRRPPR